jgi:hypothetical protein
LGRPCWWLLGAVCARETEFGNSVMQFPCLTVVVSGALELLVTNGNIFHSSAQLHKAPSQ